MLQAWGIVRSFQHLDRIFCHSHFALIFVVIDATQGEKKGIDYLQNYFKKTDKAEQKSSTFTIIFLKCLLGKTSFLHQKNVDGNTFNKNVINFPETSRDRTNLIFTFCNEFGSDSPISKLISNPFYMAKLIFMA